MANGNVKVMWEVRSGKAEVEHHLLGFEDSIGTS
jgi:hypothetical protein